MMIMTPKTQFQLDFDYLLEQLPAPKWVSTSIPLLHTGNTCLICISGFEPRCCSAAEEIQSLGWRVDKVVCVRYKNDDITEANERHRERLFASLQHISESAPNELFYDDHNLYDDIGTSLCSLLVNEGFDLSSSETHLIFDITVGTSRLLLESLHALINTNVRLTLLYSEATEYRPSYSEYRQFLDDEKTTNNIPAPEFLALGVDKVEVLRTIPGQNADARPTYLVLFPSFTPIRVIPVLEELSPSRVQWLFGVPHLIKNRWRLDAQLAFHRSLVEERHRHCYVSTFDYRESLSVLENIYKRRRNEYSLLVCSLGSKLQKVGQVLFHILRPEVGAVVSIPRTWNPDRFTGDEPREVYSVELGDCSILRSLLNSTKALRL